MADARCSCGFAPAGDETLTDHFLEVFTGADGTAADGLVHLEGEASLFCLCGAGGTVAELDAHFLAVFVPADSIGRDGIRHERLLLEWLALALTPRILLEAEGGPFTAVRPWMTSVAVGRMMVGACTLPVSLRCPGSEARSSM